MKTIRPIRIFDSRDRGRKVSGEEEIELNELDDDQLAIMLTVTATQPDGSGYATVWAEGSRPNASCLNYHDQSIANTTVTNVVDGDRFMIFVSTPTHIVIDVVGVQTEHIKYD